MLGHHSSYFSPSHQSCPAVGDKTPTQSLSLTPILTSGGDKTPNLLLAAAVVGVDWQSCLLLNKKKKREKIKFNN